MSAKPKSTVTAAEDLARVIDDLGRMNLAETQTLADRTNVAQAVRKAKADAGKSSDKYVVSVSSLGREEDDTVPPPFISPKAYKLSKLTAKASSATDNVALAELVSEFIKVMKSNTSRALTKDGFAFLDALNKQLEDPSVFIVPMRYECTKLFCLIPDLYIYTRSKEVSIQPEPFNAKLGVVARLRREITSAKNNRELATMVQDFGRVTNRSSGRTITKVRGGLSLGLTVKIDGHRNNPW